MLAIQENTLDVRRRIEFFFECASSCWICADAALHESHPEHFEACIRQCLTCAELCALTAKRLLTYGDTDLSETLVAIKMCAEECARHASTYEHCFICMRSCEDCLQMLEEVGQ